MILTLEVMGPEAAKLGAASRKVFDEAGGTIGRRPENSWVLQDQFVSNEHARIRHANGVFYIEDKSRNGICINSQDNRIEHNAPYALKSGDRIFIEPYEIRATISDAPAARTKSPFADVVDASRPNVPSPADPFLVDPFADPAPSERSPQQVTPVPRQQRDLLPGDEDVDPLRALDLDSPRGPSPAAHRAADLAGGSVASQHYRPPSVEDAEPHASSRSDLIPAEYDPLGPDSGIVPAPVVPPSAPRPSRRAKPPAARPEAGWERSSGRDPQAGDLAAMLAGAGLSNVPVTPELARNFGEILRIVVAGVMDVLQARQRIKDEFRIRVTTFKRADNNPLKFSANVEDALHNLLVKRNPAYLGAVDAFDDAFDDIRNHQMAMLAGLRAAFEATLAEFDPEHLQEDFDRQLKKGGPLLVPAKMRYWELYRERVHDMVRDAEASFRELFGERFAEAYEEQLERLKARNKPGKP